jgi:hypothetical protein
MSRETLEDDLRTQCHNKLLQWVNDTVELYRMADFGAVEIFMTLITLLVWELSRVIRTTMRNAPHLDALNHTLAQPEALRQIHHLHDMLNHALETREREETNG